MDKSMMRHSSEQVGYSATAVADQIIQKAKENGQSLTPMQVIKLVYLAHGWSLGLLRKPLIREEVEAWRFGPVFPSLYHELKRYGSSAVDGPINREGAYKLAEQDERLIDSVLQAYQDFSGIQLSQITHQPGTPWSDTYSWNSRGAVISNDLIEQHFLNLKEERSKGASDNQ